MRHIIFLVLVDMIIIEEKLFLESDIKLIYENFIHPRYEQIHGNFLENMSIIDLLFNMGENSIQILNKSKNFDLTD